MLDQQRYAGRKAREDLESQSPDAQFLPKMKTMEVSKK
jgi:hypothetical protein